MVDAYEEFVIRTDTDGSIAIPAEALPIGEQALATMTDEDLAELEAEAAADLEASRPLPEHSDSMFVGSDSEASEQVRSATAVLTKQQRSGIRYRAVMNFLGLKT